MNLEKEIELKDNIADLIAERLTEKWPERSNHYAGVFEYGITQEILSLIQSHDLELRDKWEKERKERDKKLKERLGNSMPNQIESYGHWLDRVFSEIDKGE